MSSEYLFQSELTGQRSSCNSYIKAWPAKPGSVVWYLWKRMDNQSYQLPVSTQWVGEDDYQGLSHTITTYQTHTIPAYDYQTIPHNQSWSSCSTDDSSQLSPCDYPAISSVSSTTYSQNSNFTNYCYNNTFCSTTTPSPPSTMSTTQARRLSANARERKRMSKINSGYDRLRKVLPVGKNCQLSKMEALQMAQNYIRTLQVMLNELG